MENIKKNFGFGFMRLPMQGEEVDIPETTKMVDAFLGAGFNYFDTAHGYLQGKSERALRECLTSRYPRDRYVLTDARWAKLELPGLKCPDPPASRIPSETSPPRHLLFSGRRGDIGRGRSFRED